MAKISINEQKNELFGLIVREYIASAEPVGSEFLRQKYNLNLSSATIRNKMMAIEKEGLLSHPYTSAGRVPTEAGYRYYIEHCLRKQDVSVVIKNLTQMVGWGLEPYRGQAQGLTPQVNLKLLAKELASYLKEGVFIGFSSKSTYYTGLSYLFSQPEFESHSLVCQLSEIFDKLDEVVAELFEGDYKTLNILIGRENPFGEDYGTVFLKGKIILGVLGPTRMDYDKVVPLMKEVEKIVRYEYTSRD